MTKKKVLVLLLALLLVFTAAEVWSKGDGEEAAAAAAPSALENAAMSYFADLPAGNNMISAAAVIDKLKAGEDLFILDIRQAAEYEKAHLEGSYSAPWGPAIGSSLDFLPDDQPVYVYCYTGQTAGQAVAALKVAGIPAVSIQYGWNLGIAKVAGYEDAVSTKVNKFGASEGVKFDPEIKAAVVSYFNNLSTNPNAPNNIIPAAKAKEVIDASEGDVVILSIRRAADFATARISGAINIPWGKGMQEQFSSLPKNKLIITYCYSGQTAGQAVAILRFLGYDAVSLRSGMGTPVTVPNGWINEGFPTVGN